MPVSTNRSLSSLVALRAAGAACMLLVAASIIAVGFSSAGSAMLAEAGFRQGHNLNTADFRSPATVRITAGHLSHGCGD